jgi:hypothetical protein
VQHYVDVGIYVTIHKAENSYDCSPLVDCSIAAISVILLAASRRLALFIELALVGNL